MSVKVSIITVSLNSIKTIERTIKSVLDQTYNNIEYIVIDGLSSDGTLDVLKEYAPRFSGRMKFVSEKDKGIYYAMNKGISMAAGDIIGIINSDDWYEKDAVQNVVDEYNLGHSKYAVYHGSMASYRGDSLICYSTMSPEELESKGMAAHPTCFVTMDTYRKYGLFDVKYNYVADYDLMLRLSKIKDVEFVGINKLIANSRIGGLSSTRKAYEDLLNLKVNYGLLSRYRRFVLVFKARASEFIKRFAGR